MEQMMQTSFAERLRQAMQFRDMRPIDLANKSGINKAIISSYLSGKYKAKQDNIHILAEALGVNEAWLMGYDLKMTIDERNHMAHGINVINYTPSDDSMLPLLGVDDVAYIYLKDTYDSGETILFELNNKKYIRKIIDNNDIVEFQAMNPYYPTMKYTKEELKEHNFTVIGKVIRAENSSAFK